MDRLPPLISPSGDHVGTGLRRQRQEPALGEVMSTQHASAITARLDRLPLTRHVWLLVAMLSLGGWFELYDLLMTAYVSPGLIRAGIFSAKEGLFGLPDQAAFASVTFAGLFVGTILFAEVADRFGRR